jgi:hypothetical protein
MTGDLEAAVLEGSTMLRIGTALFGPITHSLSTDSSSPTFLIKADISLNLLFELALKMMRVKIAFSWLKSFSFTIAASCSLV